MTSMTTRERFQAVTTFQPFDRLPIVEWAGWWDQTVNRWRGEGLPAAIADDRYAILGYLGMDVYWQRWFEALHRDAPKPAHHGAGVIEDEAGYERLRPYLFQMLDRWPVDLPQWQAAAARQARGERVLWFTVDGFFWFARRLLGIERHLYAFYDQPELIHRINSDLADWMLVVLDRVCTVCTPDLMTFAEDMSYNNGPMLSEETFDTFMLPYYRRVVPKLLERGVLPIVDSDGDITRAAPWFERAGIRGILPLERQAGVALDVLRRHHPRMIWVGAYDKMVMNRGEAAMRAEFERLLPVACGGGVIVSCDHQTPPGVSLDQYGTYLSLFREYAGRAAR
jgi:hypothetical protein